MNSAVDGGSIPPISTIPYLKIAPEKSGAIFFEQMKDFD